MSKCFFVALVCACLASFASGASWSYTRENGTDQWASLFPKCKLQQQSPVNIATMTSTLNKDQLQPFKFSGYDSIISGLTYKLYNNGHSGAVLFGGPTHNVNISRGGIEGTYKAFQFHLHWGSADNKGSEHTLNGVASPMELHFIHYNTKYPNISVALDNADGLLVFGVMIEISSDDTNSFIFNILDNEMDKIMYADNETMIDAFQLNLLFPKAVNDYFYYQGSLTTPVCNEVVAWHVCRNPLQISRATLAKFRSLKSDYQNENIVDNFRPVQQLHGRVVQRSFDFGSSSAGLSISFSALWLSSFLTVICAMLF